MIILTIRTEKPVAELGLYQGSTKIDYITWEAGRQLAETIHVRLEELLQENGYSLHDLQAIAVFKGPGSFTGLRIGISVANALADGLSIPIVSTQGDNWIDEARQRLESGDNEYTALPEYGAPPHITTPKK